MDFAESGLPQDPEVEKAFAIFRATLEKRYQGLAGDALQNALQSYIMRAEILSSAAPAETVAAFLLKDSLDLLSGNYAVWNFRSETEARFSPATIAAVATLITHPGLHAGDAAAWKNVHDNAKLAGLAEILYAGPDGSKDYPPYGQQCEQWLINYWHVIEGTAGVSEEFDRRIADIKTSAREWRLEQSRAGNPFPSQG